MRRVLASAVLAAAVASSAGCASAPPPVSDQVQRYYDENVKNAQAKITSSAAPAAVRLTGLPADPATLVIGDSFVEGLGLDSPETQGYPNLMAGGMGWTNVARNGIGGTGVLRESAAGGTYSTRLASLAGVTPDLVVVQGSINDIQFGSAELTKATAATIRTVATRWPTARVVVVSPITAAPSYVRLATAYEAAATANSAAFIGPETTAKWLPTNKPELRNADGWHPSPSGHEAIAAGMVGALKNLGAPTSK